MDPFEKLKQDFPHFRIRNRTTVAKQVPLANGHTTQVQGNSEALIDSSELTQIPDMAIFKPISPSAGELISYGVLVNREPVKAESKKEEVDPPKPDTKEFNKTVTK